MALAFRANGTFVAAAATTSGSIGLPAGLANGDILILPIHSRGTGNTVTTPSGYTRAAEVNITSGHRLVVFYKYVTNAAGEVAPNVTHSTSDLIAGRLTAFSGGDATTQLDVAVQTDKHGDLATVTAKTITPITAGAMAIWIFSSGDDNTLNAATQGTTAYSSDTTTGVDGSLALVYELQTNAAATGTCAMTQSANGPDNWNTVTLALRPAAVTVADPTRDLGFDSITYALEMAFGASPFATTPTWTDVSAYVRAEQGIQITRGRNTEFSDTQPGTMSFTLNNRARLFDPDYSSGTYFGQLKPMVRCRLRVRKSSVNYPIFDGYVTSFDQAYLYPREAVAVVNCVDLFTRLATRQLPPTLYRLRVLTDQPDALFLFDEDPGGTAGTAVDVTGNGHDSTFVNLNTVDSFIPGEQGSKAKQLEDEALGFFQQVFTGQGDSLTLLRTLEFWFRADRLHTDGTRNSELTVSGRSLNSEITIGTTYDLTSDPSGTGGATYVYAELTDITNAVVATLWAPISLGTPHHVAATLSSTGATFSLYLDGQLISTLSVSAFTFEGGSMPGVLAIFGIGHLDVTFAHIALYEEALSAAQLLDHYHAGMSGGNMQTVPERMDDLIAFCGLDDAGLYDDADLDANTYLGPASFSGTALSTMQQVMRSEQGRLFVDAAGVLQAQGRTADMKDLAVNATVQATLSDSGAYAYASPDGVHIQPGTVDLIRNVISVSTTGGASVTAVDDESRALFDDLEESVSTDLADLSAARNLGLSRLRRYADPTTRIDNVTLYPHGAADVRYTLVFTVDLGWRLTVTRTPQALGSALSKTVTVEGITHTLTEAQWITSLYLVPAQTVYTAQPWFVFGDATYGRFGAAAGNQLPY